ncbi:MAG: NUDIX hydrolase [Candidatus Micrarchaeota archaeon]|nr:NUDIX hydrolase [Candidatus Micrarchaeota archaeon]
MENRPLVGVSVVLVRGNKVLLGKRKGSSNGLGIGTWSFGGGHLEFGESPEECGRRELLEETGLEASNFRFLTITNDVFPEYGKHYITLFVLADYVSGEARNLEPEKCEKWEWFEWNHLPEPLYLPLNNFVKKGIDPTKIRKS